MSQPRRALALITVAVTLLYSCTGLQSRDPVQVFMVGIEPLQGQGLELRMLVKLRIQNPNEVPLDFTGVYLELNVQDKRFASGVSDVDGSVPGFGETVIDVPVSISMFRIVHQAIGMMNDERRGAISYELKGKLSRPSSGSIRFKSQGELTLPSETADAA